MISEGQAEATTQDGRAGWLSRFVGRLVKLSPRSALRNHKQTGLCTSYEPQGETAVCLPSIAQRADRLLKLETALRDVIACFDHPSPHIVITTERVEAWKQALESSPNAKDVPTPTAPVRNP